MSEQNPGSNNNTTQCNHHQVPNNQQHSIQTPTDDQQIYGPNLARQFSNPGQHECPRHSMASRTSSNLYQTNSTTQSPVHQKSMLPSKFEIDYNKVFINSYAAGFDYEIAQRTPVKSLVGTTDSNSRGTLSSQQGRPVISGSTNGSSKRGSSGGNGSICGSSGRSRHQKQQESSGGGNRSTACRRSR